MSFSYKFYTFFIGFIFASFSSQEKDTIHLISELNIDAYRKKTSLLQSTKSVNILPKFIQQIHTQDRFLETINLLPGTKMEERSPGSYRLSLRGSALRSPFGVRNVKIYSDDFILTDASGGSYLNAIDPTWFENIEIYKGPESGDFGAVTGGNLLLSTQKKSETSLSLIAGSFDTFKQNLTLKKEIGKHFLQLQQSYHQSDSYRNHSKLMRQGFLLRDDYQYKEQHELKSIILYSDLQYQTPGGLTYSQMLESPRQSRPKTATMPSAEEQKAAIYQKLVLAGISHDFPITQNLSHFILLQGSYVDFKNPFITNYEKRYESNFALRTYLNFNKNIQDWQLETRLGFEGQKGNYTVRNYDNIKGETGDPQNFDDIKTTNSFLFLSQKINYKKFLLEGSVGYQYLNYHWENVFPTTISGEKKLKPQLLPNLGLNYNLGNGWFLRGKIGKGNSSPTTEELRSSTQQINTNLNAEYGWNKEIGVRKQFGNLLFTEISLFDFRLKDAIVRKQNDDGNEYFVNAGGTIQQGVEVLFETKPISIDSKIINNIKFWISGNIYDFRFTDYQKDNENYDNNRLTGVPKVSIQNVISIELFNKLHWNISHYYTSKTPLNDANTIYGEENWIGNMTIFYPIKISKIEAKLQFQLQNIYNTKYVSGFDINAFGNRFYNPAATRNFNIGVQLSL